MPRESSLSAPWDQLSVVRGQTKRLMNDSLPLIIIGSIALLAGLLVIVFRRQIRDFTVDNEKAIFGRRAGNAAGQLQSPFWVGAAGAIGVVLGAVMLVAGVTFLISA
jgi:hypothetical protein